jgi:hypothetical protein
VHPLQSEQCSDSTVNRVHSSTLKHKRPISRWGGPSECGLRGMIVVGNLFTAANEEAQGRDTRISRLKNGAWDPISCPNKDRSLCLAVMSHLSALVPVRAFRERSRRLNGRLIRQTRRHYPAPRDREGRAPV